MSKATPLLPLLKGRLMSFPELVNAYAVSARENLRGPGQAEAALSAPVAALMRGVGELVGRRVVAHSEVTVVGDEGEAVRPDFGVRVDGVLTESPRVC